MMMIFFPMMDFILCFFGFNLGLL